MGMVKRFDIYLVNLDPTIGAEIKKTRPAIILSPNESNRFLSTVLIAPMPSSLKKYPTRAAITFQQKKGEAALDQMRAIDKSRLIKKLGRLNPTFQTKILAILAEMFAS
jgi:mRNA interferase MazF